MRHALRLGLAAGLAVLPAAAWAQMVYEPPFADADTLVIPEPGYAAQGPDGEAGNSSGVYEDEAREIARMNGLVSIDKVDEDWDHNYKVKGRDASGDRVVITIDSDTGDVLGVDD